MKAKVINGDFTGSAAAKTYEETNLNKFLKESGVDTERFYAVGATFNCSNGEQGLVGMICKDKELDGKLINLYFEEFNMKSFFQIIKQLDVIIIENGYEEDEIVKEINIRK